MRRRIVQISVAVAVVAVVLVGVPLAFGAVIVQDEEVWRGVLLVGVVGVVAVVAAVALGLWQARRLSAPLVELAEQAERFGNQERPPQFTVSGIEEVDRVAEVLETSAERVADILAAERQFARDASHQLRTPLTALSMRLEEILAAEDAATVRDEARSALDQVERLANVVEHLLDGVREQRSTAAHVKIDDVVMQQVVEWEPSFTSRARRLVWTGERGLVVTATRSGLSQVLATLLENSLKHGAGTVTVHTRSTGISVVIEVGDEGPGVPSSLGSSVFERSVSGGEGTGLGLALARDLATADGGRLELVRQKPALFALFLSTPGVGPV